ncbi:MAG: hypothetical protein H7A49_10750 [Akkermansiaceae bacterium]|nr:hypothetical protein [Akkermansiaceae bacterium]MCP5544368.1 hypothetical protein [Akkermansiaceae bacterium]MCP5547438.1 hypothetical protein [Akkermansiaceae bacterium]
MNALGTSPWKFLRPLFTAVLMVCACGPVKALDSSLNGVYTAPGLTTQVIVAGGQARSNSILNDHQAFADQFISASNSLLTGGIRITYSFEESAGESVFTVRYFVDGELLLTFVSEMRITVLQDTSDRFRTRTDWVMSVSGSTIGSFNLTTLTVEETFVFDLSNFTCEYTDAGFTTTLKRTSTGTGAGQGSPIVPRNANWRVTVVISFPIVNPTRPVWVDPPFAGGFQYDVAKGRKERIASIQLPKGFGKAIKVYAKPKSKGGAKLIGKFKSGAKVNLLKKKGFKGGAASVMIKNIKPKVNLKKKAPYPVGLTFTGLNESAAKVKTKPTNVSKGR